ncbi:MAG: phenylalanine--tRNA ligase subunit alpha [Armatimonadetes bacterium]|nr:phenylalanine--tRNA ligase subunit alpha [Armatimonadota bacterium]
MEQIAELESAARSAVAAAATTAELRELELKYLGKHGELTGLMRSIGSLSKEERPKFGAGVNEATARLQSLIDSRVGDLKSGELASQFDAERIDVTMPSRPPQAGLEHVLQQATNKIKKTLSSLGFTYYEGLELEEFKYNFEALNYPPNHPAMDDQDTFYVDDTHLLRTQGTAFQGRIFEEFKPPFRFFTVGRCFRNEAVDRTHGHTFHQVDAFMVDEGISMAHLKGTLRAFASDMFGEGAKVRFRPDFFPFVEPGVDYSISTPKLFDGKWVELGGAGMIHANILDAYGIDTERYSGFAFGLGVERVPMMAYGVDDLRYFMDNDIRFLEQFG